VHKKEGRWDMKSAMMRPAGALKLGENTVLDSEYWHNIQNNAYQYGQKVDFCV
jgi:hypothetical protein